MILLQWRPVVVATMVLAGLALGPKPLDAQDNNAPNGNAAEEDSKNPLQEWKKLTQQKQELLTQLQQVQSQFQNAKAKKKRALRREFQTLLQTFQQKVYPRMQQLAPQVYAQDPDNVAAAHVVMQTAYQQNRYRRVVKIAEKLLKKVNNDRLALNLGGVAHFALHNFQKAHRTLQKAQKAGKLEERLGGRFLKPAQEYITLWKEEQKIRAQEAAATGGEQLPRVRLKTSRGEIVLELFENEAPNTVANFISLVQNGTYQGTTFHRVIPNFVAQGGDPNTLDDDPSNDGQGGPGYRIKCECYQDDARMHFTGSISMAHSGKDTGGSQFFLTHLPTYWLNPDAEKQTGHTVFGRVVEGMDVVWNLQKGDKILSAEVLRKRDHEYEPKVIQPDES